MKIRHGFVSNSSSSSFIASIGVTTVEHVNSFNSGVVIPFTDLIKIRDEGIFTWDYEQFDWHDKLYMFDSMIEIVWSGDDVSIGIKTRHGDMKLPHIIKNLTDVVDMEKLCIFVLQDQIWGEDDYSSQDVWIDEEMLLNSNKVLQRQIVTWDGYD